MSISATTASPERRLPGREEIGVLLGATVLPFLLVVYLALEGGGYDSVVRGEVAVLVWWLILLGALIGLLPSARLGRPAWIGLAVLGGLAIWTALGVGWSASNERSMAELVRVLAYLGVFTLALAGQGPGALRRTVRALAAAIGLVGALALLSRLHPDWFPANEAGPFLPTAGERLTYPLNYWNGLAALMALGVPLLVTVAVESRRLLTQALATAALPVLALSAFYTFSRGGAGEIAVALLVLVALYARRLAALATIAIGGAGGGLVILAATRRDALEDGLMTDRAEDQGDEMILIVIAVMLAVGLLRVGLSLGARRWTRPRFELSREAGLAAAATAAVAVIAVALAAGVPGELSDRWQEFKDPESSGEGVGKFASVRGNGRYQFWESAVDAATDDPISGIGPGTFEFWWAAEGSLPTYVKDAHSLYLETWAELGPLGLLLVLGMVGGMLAYGVRATLRASPGRRPWLGAGTAALAAFAAAALIDWAWELTVLPVVGVLLAAAILREGEPEDETPGRELSGTRMLLVLAAFASLVAIVPPLLGDKALRSSQEEVRAGNLDAALDDAERAEGLQPYAATPRLQQALVLEVQGKLGEALELARQAASRDSINWRTWLVLSRIAAYRGDAEKAIEAYEKARSLNPRSTLFQQPAAKGQGGESG